MILREKRTKIRSLKPLGGVEYHNKLFLVSFQMRILAILAAMAIAMVFTRIMHLDIPIQATFILIFWLLVCALYMFLFRKGIFTSIPLQERVYLSYYFFSIPSATAIIHFLGGAGWVGFIFYVMDIFFANILFNRAKSILITLAAVASYSSLVSAEYFGLIHSHADFILAKAPYDNTAHFIATNVIVVGVWYFLLSFCVGFATNIKEERERALVASRNRFEAKSRQLEEITKALRKNVAENKYMKSATMGYIAKKEFEIEQSKKDLADQVAKLRKTQKAMAFMIDDLNQMSAQLKEGRDHLEEKVQKRTDELLEINKKLHRSERLAFLGKLAGSVTHELRNPLAVLKNAAYFLEMKLAGTEEEKIEKYLEIIKKELNSVDSIIEDIMGFAKTKPPKLKETDVKELIENSISTVSLPVMVEMVYEIEDLPLILLDSNLMLHALVNIINNAIMAMKGNGKLTIRAFRDKAHVCVEIEDNGPGIPPEERDLIFEPLYSSKPKGTGLGLPIAKMILENQEAKLDFESTLGEGTVFKIRLPIERRIRRT